MVPPRAARLWRVPRPLDPQTRSAAWATGGHADDTGHRDITSDRCLFRPPIGYLAGMSITTSYWLDRSERDQPPVVPTATDTLVDLTGVEALVVGAGMAGLCTAASNCCAVTAARTASDARLNAATTLSPSPLFHRTNTAMCRDRLVQDLVVPGHRQRQRLPTAFPRARRSLDVGHQKRHRPRRQHEPSRQLSAVCVAHEQRSRHALQHSLAHHRHCELRVWPNICQVAESPPWPGCTLSGAPGRAITATTA